MGMMRKCVKQALIENLFQRARQFCSFVEMSWNGFFQIWPKTQTSKNVPVLILCVPSTSFTAG